MDSRLFDSGHVDQGKVGLYRVRRGRSLVWQTTGGPHRWVGPGGFVELTPRTSAYLQLTRQFFRLEKVEESDVPEGATVMTEAAAPPEVRQEMDRMMQGVAFPPAGADPRGKGDGSERLSAPAKAPESVAAKGAPEEPSEAPKAQEGGSGAPEKAEQPKKAAGAAKKPGGGGARS